MYKIKLIGIRLFAILLAVLIPLTLTGVFIFSVANATHFTGHVISISPANNTQAGTEITFILYIPQNETHTIRVIRQDTGQVVAQEERTGDSNNEVEFTFIESNFSAIYPYQINLLGTGNYSDTYFIVPNVGSLAYGINALDCGSEIDGQLFIGDLYTNWSTSIDNYIIPTTGYAALYFCAAQPGGWQLISSDGRGNEQELNWITDGTNSIQNVVIAGPNVTVINDNTFQMTTEGVFSFKTQLSRDVFDNFNFLASEVSGTPTPTAVDLGNHAVDYTNPPELVWDELNGSSWEIPDNVSYTQLDTEYFTAKDTFIRTAGNLDSSTTTIGGLTWTEINDAGLDWTLTGSRAEIKIDSGTASGNESVAVINTAIAYNYTVSNVIIPTGTAGDDYEIGIGLGGSTFTGSSGFICALLPATDEFRLYTTAAGVYSVAGTGSYPGGIPRDTNITVAAFNVTIGGNAYSRCVWHTKDIATSSGLIISSNLGGLSATHSWLWSQSLNPSVDTYGYITQIATSNYYPAIAAIESSNQGQLSEDVEITLRLGEHRAGIIGNTTVGNSTAMWNIELNPQLQGIYGYTITGSSGSQAAPTRILEYFFNPGKIYTLRVAPQSPGGLTYDIYLNDIDIGDYTFLNIIATVPVDLRWGFFANDTDTQIFDFTIANSNPTIVTPLTTQNKALFISDAIPFELSANSIARGKPLSINIAANTPLVYTDLDTKILVDLDSSTSAGISSTFTPFQTINFHTTNPDADATGITQLRVASTVLGAFIDESFLYSLPVTWTSVEENVGLSITSTLNSLGWNTIIHRVLILVFSSLIIFLIAYMSMMEIFPPAKLQFALLSMLAWMIILAVLNVVNVVLVGLIIVGIIAATRERILLRGE